MGATDPEPTPEEQPEEQSEPEWPWFTAVATDTGDCQVQWGWVRDGEWTELVGDATVHWQDADQLLGVAIGWWQERWQEIAQARARAQQRAAQEAAEDEPAVEG